MGVWMETSCGCSGWGMRWLLGWVSYLGRSIGYYSFVRFFQWGVETRTSNLSLGLISVFDRSYNVPLFKILVGGVFLLILFLIGCLHLRHDCMNFTINDLFIIPRVHAALSRRVLFIQCILFHLHLLLLLILSLKTRSHLQMLILFTTLFNKGPFNLLLGSWRLLVKTLFWRFCLD